MPILEEVVSLISEALDEKEISWKNANLSLEDKSRAGVHKWKAKTKFLPEFLSDDAIEEVKKLNAKADLIISEGKIEDVIFYFNKLTPEEKKECIAKLSEVLAAT